MKSSMHSSLHIQADSMDVDPHSKGEFNWIALTQWTAEKGEERDIAYQVSLYFETVEDVNVLLNALITLKEEMYAKDTE